MGDFADKLVSRAKEIAELIESRAGYLKNRRSDLERQISDIDAELRKTQVASHRAEQFQPMMDGDYQCPFCGVNSGLQVSLYPTGKDENGNDVFRCRACSSEETSES
jgi:hypothetical protein